MIWWVRQSILPPLQPEFPYASVTFVDPVKAGHHGEVHRVTVATIPGTKTPTATLKQYVSSFIWHHKHTVGRVFISLTDVRSP